MAASLGPSWSLRTNNASPHCLTVYATPNTHTTTHQGVARKGKEHSAAAAAASVVLFGTERGSLHYRNYPPLLTAGASFEGGGGGADGASIYKRTSAGGVHRAADSSQLCIEPIEQINLQGAVKGSIVNIVHARGCYYSSEAPYNTTVASPVYLLLVDDDRGTATTSSSISTAASTTTSAAPKMSLTSSSQNNNNAGAYAAHLVTASHESFQKLPPYGADTTTPSTISSSSLSDGVMNNKAPTEILASSASTAHQQSPRLGRKMHNPINSTSQLNSNESNNDKGIMHSSHSSLGIPLPRMSCAVHHPESGYVYAAGTGVYGLPTSAALAVMDGMAMTVVGSHYPDRNDDDGDDDDDQNYSPQQQLPQPQQQQQQQQRRYHHPPASVLHNTVPYPATTTEAGKKSLPSIRKPLPPTAVYLNCNHALPMPGVRCSSSGGHQNMALACMGRVAIVAVANAFYAVPAYLNVNAIKSIAFGSTPSSSPSSSVIPTPMLSTVPNITATKIASFAQSSQVHPVIAVEIVTSPPPLATKTPMTHQHRSPLPSSQEYMSEFIRSVTSLVFLACGRECTTVEITSIPENNTAVTAAGETSSTIGGGMILSTTIKSVSHTKIYGMATLPCPILAAAPLPPVRHFISGGGGLASGPLIALLTVDGLVHIRSPLCYAVPLTSIEVGTRLNDFFTLSTLQSLPSFLVVNSQNHSPEGRTFVATSYGGESRLICVHDTESSQDFADRLMRLCIDAFGSNGFPRLELAESLGATFLATSYGGGGGIGAQQELSSSSVSTTTLMQYHQKRTLLKQYLECVLGLADDILERVLSSSAAVTSRRLKSSISSVSVVLSEGHGHDGCDVEVEAIDRGINESVTPPAALTLGANTLLTCTALLCLVSFQLSPPDGSTAVRASRACASAVGIVLNPHKDSSFSSLSGIISKTAVTVCELVADRLLKEVSSTLASNFSLLTASSSVSNSSSTNRASFTMEFVETAIWLLRSCGCHEKAINVLQERMNSPAFRNAAISDGRGSSSMGGGSATNTGGSGGWSQIKFDSYLATHLGELWSSNDDQCRQLVLVSPATRDLIARNPTLGLSIFTTIHPRNEIEWKMMKPEDDPLVHPLYPSRVVELLKSISPQQSSGIGGVGVDVHHEHGAIECLSSFSQLSGHALQTLPLHSGRALAVSYLESAIGIGTGRQPSNSSSSPDSLTPSRLESSHDVVDEYKADMHDELSYLLLEGVISERGDDDVGVDSNLGARYRYKLRRLLSWPSSRIRSERLLGSLPLSFLREHALCLGRLGRHEDALQILYFQEKSLELALEYCDVRHERQQAHIEEAKKGSAVSESGVFVRAPTKQCAYIPLIKVALSIDPDTDRGTAAAIKVLALRRDSIDKAAVLRLLPKNIPMSSLVRPFLIPAMVEDESQVRRLTVASSLLRSRMINLKKKLADVQLESQASLYSAPALQRLNLGAPLHSSKPATARPVHTSSPYYPDVLLTKHFFPRYLVIQAQVTNISATSKADHNRTRTLANVAFAIAESSDDALIPTMELPIKTLSPGAMGCAWCVIAVNPQRLDGAAFLTCELRFTLLEVDADSGVPLQFSVDSSAALGQIRVEELHDIEVRHTDFY